MTIDKLTEAALACVKAGVSIIPIDHKTKKPCRGLSWKPYQQRIAGETTVKKWFAAGAQSFAVIGGKVSGGLLVFDFDVERLYHAWRGTVGELADGLPVQRTGSGTGYQVFLRCENPGGNDKLAWVADEQEETGRTIGIETRGEGGYAIVPPSLHPSGNRYEMIAGSLSEIPVVAQARIDALLAAARKLDECPHTRQERERLEIHAREAHKEQRIHNNGQASVIDAFNAAHPIDAVLEAHGYVRGLGGRYIRPGGKSESVSIKDRRSCHWSSNDPLNDGKIASGFGVHDAFDVYCYYEHRGDLKAAIKAAANRLGLRCKRDERTDDRRSRWATSPSCVASVDPYMPFPVASLPQPVARFVDGAAGAIGCDPSYVAVPLLAGLASAIGNTRRICLKHSWCEPAIVWGVIVGDSGTLKSPALEVALRPIRRRQQAAMKAFTEAMDAYKVRLMQYEKELTTWKRSSTGGETPVKPEEPQADRCWCDDTTIEALAVLLQQNPRGLLLKRDELAGWLGSFDRYSQGRGADAAKWLEMFGGRSIMVDRKSGQSKTIYIQRAAVSVTGTIQPETLRRALGVEHRENGLAARLLLACPPRQAKRWTEDDISHEIEGRMEDLFDKLYSLQMVTDSQGDAGPLELPLTPQAKTAWVHFYDGHAQEQEELTGDLAAAWSKLEGYAARLGLIVHLVRWAAGDPTLDNPNMIDERSIEAGVRLSQWFGHEASRVYAILGESDEQRDQRRLVEVIQRKGGSMTPRELMRSKHAFQTAKAAEQALDELAKAGYGHWEDPPIGPAGGHPTRRFVLDSIVDTDETLDSGVVSEVVSTSTVPTETGCTDEQEERAAIREYEGGLTREDAERLSATDVDTENETGQRGEKARA
jgi:hypothetical protein